MNEVINIVGQLEKTSSTNAKLDILRKNKDIEKLKRVLYYTYSDNLQYGFSEPKLRELLTNDSFETHEETWANGFDMLDKLASSNINDSLRTNVKTFLLAQNEEERELWIKILTKDLRCNISTKSINKAMPKLIPSFGVQLASKYFDCEDKVNGEFCITTKLDGNRIIAIKHSDDNIKFFSRQGKLIEGLVEIENELKLLPDGYVYDGELLAVNTEKLSSKDLYRKTMQIGRKDGIKKGLQFHMFDIVTVEGFNNGIDKTPCSKRKQLLHDLLSKHKFTHIVEVPILYKGTDKDMVIKLLNEAKARDEEGVMLNVLKSPYECKRSKGILKVKVFNDADLRVVGILEGTGKNKGKLGAITVEFEHEGKIYTCDCGSGFKDDERKLYFNNPELIMGKIVTIGYFEISNNKQGGVGLRFPTWAGKIRNDKTEISMN